jgi:hypothetical protein
MAGMCESDWLVWTLGLMSFALVAALTISLLRLHRLSVRLASALNELEQANRNGPSALGRGSSPSERLPMD